MSNNSSNKIPVMSISLDYAVIEGESLGKLTSFLKRYGIRRGKFGLVKRIYTLCRRRSNSDISQRRFKFELMRSVRAIKNRNIGEEFARNLMGQLNPKVKKRADKFVQDGGRLAIVTSAPGEYAEYVAEMLGADICIATPSLSEFRRIYPHDPIDYEECVGSEKVDRLITWLDEINGTLDTVISGEPDDMPLLMMPEVKNKYIAAHHKNLRRMLKRNNVFYEKI